MVMAYRDDTRKNAKITLTIIIALLAVSAAGHCVPLPGVRRGRDRSGAERTAGGCSRC